jgi:ABC-2 type transport system ATP-binding protein
MATIEVTGLTKRFGDVLAVDDLSFRLEPGTITGFLGPNGAGKTTTMRMLLGLIHPTNGQATIDGRRYAELVHPANIVGALLDPGVFHPGRRARHELLIRTAAAGLPDAAAHDALERVGLADVAHRRVGGFSMGMRQRLALAAALLGDPQVLILDEPANGLDPEGVHWLRQFVRSLGDEGRTVMVSSHLLAEVAQTVDDVVVIAKGRLVRQAPLAELTAGAHPGGVRVRTPQVAELRAALEARHIQASARGEDEVLILGATTEAVGNAVAQAGVVIYEMRLEEPNLEDAFLELTGGTERSES